jgi:hypothetical protein
LAFFPPTERITETLNPKENFTNATPWPVFALHRPNELRTHNPSNKIDLTKLADACLHYRVSAILYRQYKKADINYLNTGIKL